MFVAKTETQHKHDFEDLETHVAIRRVVNEDGKTKRDVMTAKDVLKQRRCKGKIGDEPCGFVETYDLKRRKM